MAVIACHNENLNSNHFSLLEEILYKKINPENQET